MASRYAIIFGNPQRNRKGEYINEATVVILRNLDDDFDAVDAFEHALNDPDLQAIAKKVKLTKVFLVEIIDERSL